MLTITQYFKRLGVMAHLFVEFRDDANVESQVGVMLTFIHSCGSKVHNVRKIINCLLYTSPSPRDQRGSRMPSSA